MTSEHWHSIKAIFSEAIEREPRERDAFLRTACGSDPELLTELQRMLHEHESESGLSSTPAFGRSHPFLPRPGPRFTPGQVLASRFRVIRFIAAGGMGEVYEAEDLELHEHVALKTIAPHILDDERALALFKKEIQLARRVTHPNVCRIYDVVQHEDALTGSRLLLLSMELIPGETLASYLRAHSALSSRPAMELIEQIGAAVQAAHDRAILHRDLKPGNVLLVANASGAEMRAVVMDFGLAHSTLAGGPQTAGGTPGYSAPEQLQGGAGTTATDVYSLALVIAEMVGLRRDAGGAGGIRPADPRQELARDPHSDIPPRWLGILRRCLDPDPNQRYARPADVVAALRAEREGRSPRRKFLLAAAGTGLVAGAAWWGRALLRPHPPVWILPTALDNRTGNALLDDTVPFLLEREIGNSSDVYVIPRVRVEDTLRLMRKDRNTRLNEALAREVSLRDGGIQMIACSRAEPMGSGYLLSITLKEVVSGRSLGGASEEVPTLRDIVGAVRRLASATRRLAGEKGLNIGHEAIRLQHVTTPSLPACKLYSQAYGEAQELNWSAAEQLARAAIAEDPQFASAHLWLAWAIHNVRKPEALWREALDRAVALSGSATDRERQFILASEQTLKGNPEAAVVAYRRMLAAYPDDFWARNNLAADLARLDRLEEADQEWFRLAEIRPHNLGTSFRGLQYASASPKVETTRRWRERLRKMTRDPAQQLAADGPGPAGRGWTVAALAHWVDSYDLQELWVAGKLGELKGRVDAAAHRATASEAETRTTIGWYQTLGRLRDAQALNASWANPLKAAHAAILAYVRDDARELQANLVDPHTLGWFPAVLLTVRADWKREQLPSRLRTGDADDWALIPDAESRLAALNGDLRTAARKLADWNRQIPPWARVSVPVLLTRMLLAHSYELAGDDAASLQAWEAADIGPAPLYPPFGISSAAFWQRIRYERARLLRKLGRSSEAEGIETALKQNLRLADAEHPILVRLREPARCPFTLY